MICISSRTTRRGLALTWMLTSMSACDGDDGVADEVGMDSLTSADSTDDDGSGDTGTQGETGTDPDTGTDTGETANADEGTDSTDTTDDGEDPLSFEVDVYPIILGECSCHLANMPGGLPMPNAAAAYANLVDVASIQVQLDRVEPGDPQASHLYKKITNTQAFGAPMPSLGPLLTSDQVMIIETWILGGALE